MTRRKSNPNNLNHMTYMIIILEFQHSNINHRTGVAVLIIIHNYIADYSMQECINIIIAT